jgi:hypothetical protein
MASVAAPQDLQASSRKSPWATPWILAVVLLAGGLFAYFQIFSGFTEYDDEGFMMMSVRFWLNGGPLYQASNPSAGYGPFYYFSRWLAFGFLPIPLTHDWVRIFTVVMWIAAAALAGAIALRLAPQGWNRIWLAAFAGAIAFLHLNVLAREPGHPQDLIVVGVMAALVGGAFFRENRAAAVLVLLGAVSAALLLTKVNVGVFFSAACVLTLAAQSPQGKAWAALRWMVAIATVALPLVLMRSVLLSMWGNLCFSVMISLSLCIALAFRQRPAIPLGFRAWLWFVCGAAIMAAAMIGFALAYGNSLSGMVNCLVLWPARCYQGLDITRLCLAPCGRRTVVLCAAAIVPAIGYTYCRQGRFRVVNDQVLAWLKLALPLLTFFTPWLFVTIYGPAWIWLVLIVPGHRQPRSGELFFRQLLCFVALLQVLQTYPISGSQVEVGTISFVPLAVLCLADWMESMQNVFPRKGALLAGWGGLFAGLPAIALLGAGMVRSIVEYRSLEAVEFPGCRLVRMSEERAAISRWLVQNVRSSDTFVGKFGLYSLSFWTGREPASPVLVASSCKAFPDEIQRQMIAKYRAAGNVIAIDYPGAIQKYPWETTLLGQFIRADFQPFATAANFTLLRRKGFPQPSLPGCAWYEPEAGDGEQLPANGSLSTLRLRLEPPDKQVLQQVARVEVVDLANRTVLAETTFNGVPQPAIRHLDEGAGVTPAGQSPSPQAELRVTVGRAFHDARCAGVRLIDSNGKRLITLVVARDLRHHPK